MHIEFTTFLDEKIFIPESLFKLPYYIKDRRNKVDELSYDSSISVIRFIINEGSNGDCREDVYLRITAEEAKGIIENYFKNAAYREIQSAYEEVISGAI